MRALVTGATGFIGANVVRALLADGYKVRALVRQNSPRRNIEGLDVEVTVGDLRDKASLDKALEGCDALFHVAAMYSFWTPRAAEVYAVNVAGTRNILTAAGEKGIRKVVYTSSESTIGCKNGCAGTEALISNESDLSGHYKKSKLLAEKVALEMCRDGLPLVVVNPTTPVGEYDITPTPTGQFILDFLNGRMPAYVNTGLNIIDVADVARGHVLALEKGRPGERYILGNRNLTFREILDILADITGRKAPQVRVPIWLALGAAGIDEAVAGRVLRRTPRIPVAAVRTSRKFRHFDCTRAINELGLPQTPVEEALRKSVAWFRRNGYCRGGKR